MELGIISYSLIPSISSKITTVSYSYYINYLQFNCGGKGFICCNKHMNRKNENIDSTISYMYIFTKNHESFWPRKYMTRPLWIKKKSVHAQLTILELTGCHSSTLLFLQPSTELFYWTTYPPMRAICFHSSKKYFVPAKSWNWISFWK